ncbi:MAG: signal recognition particle protein [Dehalococcoidia bacterium]|nr:signal recognition particle protein [Dehalococcoidia bacterium]
MFEALTDKLTGVFRKLGGRGRLTEKEIDEALREVRVALLEADVAFRVARDFVARVKSRAMEGGVLESMNPAQQIIGIVQEELTNTLGGAHKRLAAASQPPTIIMLAGLQGAGKTTTAAKLALMLKKQGQRVLLVAADVKRPAAVQQLVMLGKQLDIPVYDEGTSQRGPEVCAHALKRAKELDAAWVILDTAGRLHVDAEMMGELKEISQKLKPAETLLVVDAMTGQDAVRAAEEFHREVSLTGLILTKMDGDARGGAALSITAVTGLPIKYLGMGEKSDALEAYHPDRLASRILGMGDMATLVEKAQATMDQQKAKDFEQKLRKATFDLDDFLEQLRQIKKMGSVAGMLDMLPGMGMLTKRIPKGDAADKQMAKVEAIILSMTAKERRNPEIIGGSRRKRIAAGSGTTPADINQMLSQFEQIKKMMKRMASGKTRMPKALSGMFR